MSLFLIVLLCVPALATGGLLGWVRRPSVHVDPPAKAVLDRLQRRRGAAVGIGAALGVVVAAAMLAWPTNDLGRLASLAPSAAGVTALLIVALAELTTPHLEGRVRTASLVSRRRRDAVDAPAARAALTAFVVLILALAAGWAMGSPDDLGRPGRSISTVCATTGESRGPWPGSFYGGLLLCATGVLAMATVAAVAAVSGRPRLGATGTLTDTRLRRTSTAQILRMSAASVAATLVPVSGLMAVDLLGLGCRPWWYLPLGIFWLVVMVAGCGLAAAALGAAAWGPRVVTAPGESGGVR